MRAEPPNSRRAVLVLVAGGGFQWQASQLLRDLAARHLVEIVTAADSVAVIERVFSDYTVHALPRVTDRARPSALATATGFAAAVLKACRLLRRTAPAGVVTIGSSLSVPLLIAARITRTPGVYIESITRVNRPSRTGRLIARLRLADRFYVQWPEAASLYRGAVYRGTVL